MKLLNLTFSCLLITFLSYTQNCDNIILKDGSEIASIIEEIRSNEIAYKKCNYTTGPLYIVLKNEVFMIKYKNGTSEVINNNVEEANPSINNLEKQNNIHKESVIYFFELTDDQKNDLINANICYKVVPYKTYGKSFSATIRVFKKQYIDFIFCNSKFGKLLNYNHVEYIENESGIRIYFKNE